MRPWLLSALLLVPALAGGQPSVASLRARLDALPATAELEGARTGVRYVIETAERIERNHRAASARWRGRAEQLLTRLEAGEDPYARGAGQILNRGYEASFSPRLQGYAVYLPRGYDPSRTYPLALMLHGGSSNGNLFLAVVLGNNLDWESYRQQLYDDFTPRWFPDFIVVAPDGVGQVMWRWMGEQDVLEVLDDVQRHYSVDPERIVLGGLSNGGVGAYAVGSRHAWRFSHVQAMAGAPSWVQYAGGRPTRAERVLLERLSAMSLWENTLATDFRAYHGTQDPGPMRPAFVRELDRDLEARGLPRSIRWFEHGHDLLYLVHRHGRVYGDLASLRQQSRPTEVRVATGDYRAARQHWVEVSRVEGYPEIGRVHATVEERRVTLETARLLELTLRLSESPLPTAGPVTLVVDGEEVYDGPRAALGHRLTLHRGEAGWALGFLPAADGLEKVPGLSGPLSDAYHDLVVHVYGTAGDARTTERLRRTAERGAGGWPTGVWSLDQPVLADTEVDASILASAHVALYGAPGQNRVLDRIAEALPIRVQGETIRVGGDVFRGTGLGTRFIYPNPERPDRYVIVHTGVDADAVSRTRNLPDFLPDYVVYDRRTTARRPRLIAARQRQMAAGFFDRFWQLPEDVSAGATTVDPSAGPRRLLPPGVSRAEMRRLALAVGAPADFVLPSAVLAQTPPSRLPPGEVPATPPRPRRFAAARDDPNGPIAREIARLVPTFLNYRAIIPGGVWRTRRRAIWQVRNEAACLEALAEGGVEAMRVEEALGTPIPTPVRLGPPIGGVTYAPLDEAEEVVVSCELAARLPYLSRVLRRQGVRRVLVMSSHRTRPMQSFHRMGMALDIWGFELARGGSLVVDRDFVETPAHRTCDAPEPPDPAARALLRIACELGESGRFQSVLTPNYNDGHRNHFHLDIRPDDPRTFLR